MIEITKKLAIIILNWNGLNDTIECLASIDKFLPKDLYKIFLIDNHSKQLINKLYVYENILPIEIISLKTNVGFAAGNNVGILKALKEKFEFIILLNNDTVIIDDSILKMKLFLENNINIQVVGAVNYYYSNPDLIWSAGVISDINTLKKSVSLRNFDRTSSNPITVDLIPGSSLMFKSNIITKVGILDYKYFAYYEEFDWLTRVKKAGYKIVFLPNTKILHKVGRSSQSKLKLYFRVRNSLYFYKKHTMGIIRFLNQTKIILKFAFYAIKTSIKIKENFFFVYINGINDYRKENFYRGNMHKYNN